MPKLQPIKLVTDNVELAIILHVEGGVMHAPLIGAARCEITKPGEDTVAYECSTSVYLKLVRTIDMLGAASTLVHVVIEELGCTAGWCIVAVTNKDALQYRADPARIKPDPDDTDEGDDGAPSSSPPTRKGHKVVLAPKVVLNRYEMQDRSGGKVNRTDPDLSLQQVYAMTDFSEEEVQLVAHLTVGQELLIGGGRDISVRRTA